MTAAHVGWIASAVILLAPLLEAARRRWQRPWMVRCLEVAAPIALVALSAWVYWPLVQGHSPTTHDHNFGVLKTVEAQDLLQRHELVGWSDFEDAGFPANLHYPIAGTLLELTLSELPGSSIEKAHAWCIWMAMVSMMLACYLAARLHFGVRVGLVAGAFALFDPGEWWVGGNFMVVEIGMWVQTLGTALVIAGLGLWPVAVDTGRRGVVAATGLVFGLAVLFHPQAVLLASFSGAIMLLALLATPKLATRTVVLRTAAIVGLTALTCAFWMIPYIANRATAWMPEVAAVGSPWVWDQFTAGTLLRGPGLWLGAATAGILFLAPRRDPYSRFLAMVVPAFTVVFTVDALNLYHLRDPQGGGFVDGLQLTRMYYLQRPLTLIAAGFALGAPLWRAIRRFAGRGSTWARMLNRAVGAVLVWTVFQVPGARIPGRPENPLPLGLVGDQLTQANAAIDYALSQMKPGERLVIHYDDAYNHNLLYQVALRHVKVMKIGGDAAMMFKNHFTTDALDLIERIGGSVMISRGPLPDSMKGLPLQRSFGDLEVRTLPRVDRAWMEGPGQVEVVSWKDEEIHLRVRQSQPSSHIRLGLAYFDSWQTDDGVKTTSFDLHEAKLSELPARDGDIVLRYHRPQSQPLGVVVSLVGWGAVIAWQLRRWWRSRRYGGSTQTSDTLAPALIT